MRLEKDGTWPLSELYERSLLVSSALGGKRTGVSTHKYVSEPGRLAVLTLPIN